MRRGQDTEARIFGKSFSAVPGPPDVVRSAICKACHPAALSEILHLVANPRQLLDLQIVPASKPRDALQLAMATIHDVDYLLTWNYAHLALQELRFTHSLQKRARKQLRMLVDSEVERILGELRPCSSDVLVLVRAVLEKIVCCPICRELFSRSTNELKGHLVEHHSEKFVPSGLKQITDHYVEEGDRKIYICPQCHFAVGKESHMYGGEAQGIIRRHVQECRHNFIKRTERDRLSFLMSSDVKLISDYVGKCAEIGLYLCPNCNHSFGSVENLVRHLVLDHSSACAEDLTEEQKQPIQEVAQRLLDRMAPPETIPSIVPGQTTDVEIAEHSSREDEPEQAQIPKGPQDKVPPRTPTHRYAQSVGKEFSRTVKQADIDAGFLVLPKRLANCLMPANRVTVHLAGDEHATVLSFHPFNRSLKDLTKWFRKSAIEPGDRIKLRLLRLKPPEIRIWTEWDKHLNYLLRCPAVDFKWKDRPIRDCLIKVFAIHQGPTHYRSLYSQISKHRDLVVGSVIATLSKHRGVLFTHRGRGEWSRLAVDAEGHPGISRPIGSPPKETTLPEETNDAIWYIVAGIEKYDVVYKLLKKTRDSLSFDQICQRIAKGLRIAQERGIDWHELRHTGFLNTEDQRLKRLDNGHFALCEWDDPIPRPSPPREIEPVSEIEPIPPMIDNLANSPPRATVPQVAPPPLPGEIEAVPEREPLAPIVDDLANSSRRAIVEQGPQGLLSKIHTIFRQIVGRFVRWVSGRFHG